MESNTSCLEEGEVCTSTHGQPTKDCHLERAGSGANVVLDAAEAESRKLSSSSSHYKGVVPQPNGRWGAQIYEKCHRIWLGTFNFESAAAYDVAAQRFRDCDAVTNFPSLDDSASELRFISSRSKSEIVDMLRKHTYRAELDHFTTSLFGFLLH